MVAAGSAVSDTDQSLYFVSPWIDYALIGGVSILAFFGMWAFHDGKSMEKIYVMTAFLTLVVNHPHFAATNFRMYHSKANILQFPVTALVVPVVILLGVLASIAYPQVVAPYFVKLFILWSPYHFSGQSVGVTMIYARRAGFKVGIWERRALSGFIFACFVTTLLTFDTRPEGYEYFGMTYPGLGLPEWMVTVSTVFLYTCAAGVLALVVRWCRAEKRILPPIVLLPAVTHYVWFLGGTKLPAFQEFVPFFHSLQYLVIAWAVQLRESMDGGRIEPSRRFVWMTTLRWWAICVALGYAMFNLTPYLFPTTGVTFYFLTGIVAAGVQMHHFFVDGVIWKLKNKTNVSPVMSSLADFLGARRLPQPVLQAGATVV